MGCWSFCKKQAPGRAPRPSAEADVSVHLGLDEMVAHVIESLQDNYVHPEHTVFVFESETYRPIEEDDAEMTEEAKRRGFDTSPPRDIRKKRKDDDDYPPKPPKKEDKPNVGVMAMLSR